MCYRGELSTSVHAEDSQEYFIHVPHSEEVAVVIIDIEVDASDSRHGHYHNRYPCHRRSHDQLKYTNHRSHDQLKYTNHRSHDQLYTNHKSHDQL